MLTYSDLFLELNEIILASRLYFIFIIKVLSFKWEPLRVCHIDSGCFFISNFGMLKTTLCTTLNGLLPS